MVGKVPLEAPSLDALLSFVGRSLLSLQSVAGGQSHNLAKLGYSSHVNDFIWQLSSSQKGG